MESTLFAGTSIESKFQTCHHLHMLILMKFGTRRPSAALIVLASEIASIGGIFYFPAEQCLERPRVLWVCKAINCVPTVVLKCRAAVLRLFDLCMKKLDRGDVGAPNSFGCDNDLVRKFAVD
jgi:hypothetical protein